MIKKTIVLAVTMMAVVPFLAQADTITRQLQLGMSGSDVSSVQTFLANDRTLYPQGLVTGYYGFLTKSAVSNFQIRNGLPGVGRIGPATLPIINQQMSGMVSVDSTTAPIISGVIVGVNSQTATIAWNTNELAKGMIYYSTSPLSTYENENSVNVSGSVVSTDMSERTYQNVSIANLQSNTTYYYMIYVTDQSGNVSVTVPSTFQTL